MHINADYVVVETLDAIGDDSGPRTFAVTSLRSYGVPFIRYVNQDCGRLLGGSCPCGSGFPLMDLEISRVLDHFVLPGGRVVHGLFLIHRLYGTEGVANFQFQQTAVDHINLWLVPVPGKEAQLRVAVEKVLGEIRACSGGPLTIDVIEVDTIPLSAAGKHRFIRSDLQPAVSAALRS
jgi:phenylacetate-CoA ligase